jgi:hypothetical protein
VSIPVPGASFVYSLLKDVWSWGSTRFRGRRLAAEVFRGWTVDEWLKPGWALMAFGEDTDWLEYHSDGGQYATFVSHVAEGELEPEDNLHFQLVEGHLVARGFREPFAHGAPYLTISRHEWRIVKLDDPIGSDRASGGGISYIAVTIGKPGTKRLFLRSK